MANKVAEAAKTEADARKKVETQVRAEADARSEQRNALAQASRGREERRLAAEKVRVDADPGDPLSNKRTPEEEESDEARRDADEIARVASSPAAGSQTEIHGGPAPTVTKLSSDEETVTMVFPRPVTLTADDGTRIHFGAGAQEVPVKHAGHPYLAAHGVKPYGREAEASVAKKFVGGRPVVVVRDANKTDAGWDEKKDQVVVRFEDGSVRTVARGDVK